MKRRMLQPDDDTMRFTGGAVAAMKKIPPGKEKGQGGFFDQSKDGW